MWIELVATGTGSFIAGWYLRGPWNASSAEYREAVRHSMSRLVNLEEADYLRHKRKVELMRAGRRTQRLEDNPKQPARVHRIRRRRAPLRLDPEIFTQKVHENESGE